MPTLSGEFFMNTTFRLLIALAAVLVCTVSTAFADPHCRQCPYSCADIGLSRKDCSFVSNARGICCLDLTDRGMELALEQERAAGSYQPSQPHYPSRPVVQDRCPAGFTPSEQKCSPQERRNGCKDVRTPSGLGCVKR